MACVPVHQMNERRGEPATYHHAEDDRQQGAQEKKL